MKSYLGYVYFRFGQVFDPRTNRWLYNGANVIATLADFTIMNLERVFPRWYDHNARTHLSNDSTLAKTALLFKNGKYDGKGICKRRGELLSMKRLVEVYEAEISPWVMHLLAQRGVNTVPIHKFGVEWGRIWSNKYLCITNSCPYYALKESRIFK